MDENNVNSQKKKSSAGKIIAIILLICIVGTLAAFGGIHLYNTYLPVLAQSSLGAFLGLTPAEEQPAPAPAEPKAEEAPKAEIAEAPAETPVREAPAAQPEVHTVAPTPTGELSMADIYEQQVNSTVGITISATATASNYGYGYWGGGNRTYTYKASGSGFIITEDGYILTNYHVIEDCDTVTVACYDGQTYSAEVIGYDSSNDIAVIKIDAENLKPVTLGDSDTLRVGDFVLAIGNPLGELTFSLTHGVVSALSRDVQVGSGSTMSLIQTDCAINSGNSGGALFNMKGEVIGITNAKYSSSGSSEASIDNIGFAIPINNVRRIVASIIENGYILKPYIGVTVGSVSEETMSITGISAGAWVRDVTEGGPADLAGLKVNDVIVKVDDTEISSSSELITIIGKSEPDSVHTLDIYRQGTELQLAITIGSREQAAIEEKEEPAPAAEAPKQDGSYGNNYGTDPYSYWNDWFSQFFGY